MRRWMLRLGVLLLVGCGGAAPPTTADIQPVSTDQAALAKHINLPGPPLAVQWMITSPTIDPERGPGPALYTLVAVLEYDAATLADLTEQAGAPSAPSGWMYAGDLRDWQPEALRLATTPSATDTRMVNIALPIYDPTPFLRADTGWQPGYWLVVDSYVVVNLWQGG